MVRASAESYKTNYLSRKEKISDYFIVKKLALKKKPLITRESNQKYSEQLRKIRQ